MDYSSAVGFVERVGDLNRVPKSMISRQGALRETIGKRVAFDEFHHQVVDPILLADVIERADVRVIQTRGRASFALESLAYFGIGRKMPRQNLYSDDAIQTRITCSVDLPHPAGTYG
jgi:hypothetical protein